MPRQKKNPTVAPATIDWTTLIADFGDYLRSLDRSPQTVKGYCIDLVKFAAWAVDRGIDKPADLGLHDVREYKAALIASGAKPQTINRPVAALRTLTTWARAQGHCQVDLATIRSEREETPPPKWLERKEQNALMRAVAQHHSDPTEAAAIALMLHAGLRVAEAAEVKWGDVEISDRKGVVTVRCGKGRKRRRVPLNTEAREALNHLRVARCIPRDDASHVLRGQRGELGVRGLQHMVKAVGDQAKIEGLYPHILRHTFCRRLAESGARLETIAALAGHERIETTRRYVEPGEEDLARAVEMGSSDTQAPPSPRRAGRPRARA